MSDLSALSHEYKTASELLHIINDALIMFKKVRYNLADAQTISAEEFSKSRQQLADILMALIALLEPQQGHEADSAVVAQVPGSLVARLREQRHGDLPYYLDDLQHVATSLRMQEPMVGDADLEVLDGIAAVVDEETSSVFRRMMRR